MSKFVDEGPQVINFRIDWNRLLIDCRSNPLLFCQSILLAHFFGRQSTSSIIDCEEEPEWFEVLIKFQFFGEKKCLSNQRTL